MKTKITPDMVKTLRERTGVGMAKCKEALDTAQGDMEAAIDILRKEGAASAVKKASREANEGLIGAKESAKAIALVQVNAETDFVIKNDKFLQFIETFAEDALVQGAPSLHMKKPVSSLCRRSEKTSKSSVFKCFLKKQAPLMGSIGTWVARS